MTDSLDILNVRASALRALASEIRSAAIEWTGSSVAGAKLYSQWETGDSRCSKEFLAAIRPLLAARALIGATYFERAFQTERIKAYDALGRLDRARDAALVSESQAELARLEGAMAGMLKGWTEPRAKQRQRPRRSAAALQPAV